MKIFSKNWVLAAMMLIGQFSLYSQFQHQILPLQFYAGDESPIKLIGGDPEFAIKCFQSDLGRGREEIVDSVAPVSEVSIHATIHEWLNISKKQWSKHQLTFRLSYCNKHPDFYLFLDSVNCIWIECFDNTCADLLHVNSKVRNLIIRYISDKLFRDIAYVNSSNGVNIRKEPDVNSPIVHKYSDASKLVVIGKTEDPLEIKVGDSSIWSKWVYIFVGNGVKGYVPEIYLLPWHALHPRQIEELSYISLEDSLAGKYFFYSSNPKVLNETGDEFVPNPEYLSTAKNELHKYLSLEEVRFADFKTKRIKNPYQIDTSYADAPTPKTSGGVYPPGSFYLKINNNKNTIYIQERASEYPESREYIGKIPGFNHYVFRAFSFGDYYTFYDMQDGSTGRYHFSGIPYFSPDQKYAVSFMETVDPELMEIPHSALLTICKIDEQFKTRSIFTVDFASWFPDETPNSAFWISDRELILKVRTVNTAYYSLNGIRDRNLKQSKMTANEEFKYLKLTIR